MYNHTQTQTHKHVRIHASTCLRMVVSVCVFEYTCINIYFVYM